MIDKDTLPKNWEVVRLGDFVKTEKGKKPKFLSKEKSDEFSIPYVNIKVFEKNIIEEYTNGIGCVFCEKDDFLMVWDGSRSGYIGRAIDGALGSTLVRLKFPNISDKYAFYFLKSKYIEINTKAKGVGIPHVDPSLVWNYSFPIPPLAEQERIVARIEELFSELDAGIESLKTAQQQLKTYRQSVLKYAFEGKLTNDNVKEGELPNGWKLRKISEIAEVRLGRQRSPQKAFGENMCKYLRAANVTWDGLDLSDVKSMNFSPKEQEIYRLREGDILLSEASGSISEVGKAAIWKEEIVNCCMQNTLIRVRPFDLVSSKFLHIRFYFDAKVGNFRKIAKGVGIHHLGAAGLSNWSIPIPSRKEQQRIVEEIESRLSVCDKLEETITASLKQSEALRQSILKMAFEGKLVKQVEIKGVETSELTNFQKLQVLGFILYFSRLKHVTHGEMTLAKYAYLLNRIYGIPIYKRYERWHLGPFPTEIKTHVKNTYFKSASDGLMVVNQEKLFKYVLSYKDQIETGVNELAGMFSSTKDLAKRSRKTELLATVCKVIEDIKTTEFTAVRNSMAEWKIDLKGNNFRNKAEKFGEDETAKCIEFILKKGWDKKLIEREGN